MEEVRCCTLEPAQAAALESALRGVGAGVQGVLRGRESRGVAQLLEDLVVVVAERSVEARAEELQRHLRRDGA